MSGPGLFHEDVMRGEVVNRMHPPVPLLPLLVDGLRRIGQTSADVAEAMLRPESPSDEESVDA